MCSLLRVRVSASMVVPVNPRLQLHSWTWGGKDKRITSKSECALVHAVKVYGEVEAFLRSAPEEAISTYRPFHRQGERPSAQLMGG
jgi:hypothetical protein